MKLFAIIGIIIATIWCLLLGYVTLDHYRHGKKSDFKMSLTMFTFTGLFYLITAILLLGRA